MVRGVDAVVLCGPDAGAADLTELLDGLIPCAEALGRVLLIGGVFGDRSHRLFDTHGVMPVEVPSGPESPLTRVCRVADGSGAWWWLLDADSRPDGDALTEMLGSVRGSSRVGIVGPKLVAREQPRTVLRVGHRLTRWGRSLDAIDEGAWDQGQFDERSDVLGVPLSGMLIRRDVLTEVGGLDPAFDPAVAGLDLSWRAHLVGYRVLVAPRAVIAVSTFGTGWSGAYESAGTRVGRPARLATDRALVALARGSLWRLPARSAAMLLTSLMSTLTLLMLRAPRAAALAWAESRAVLWPWSAWAARWRFRGRATVGERDLTGLFASDRARRHGIVPHRLTAGEVASSPGRKGVEQDRTGARSIGAIEAGPISDEAHSIDDDTAVAGGRWWSWPLVASVAVTVAVSSARWRDLGPGLHPAGWGVRGAELTQVAADPGHIWAAWSLPWSGQGLGRAGQGAPWLMPMSGWTWLLQHFPAGPDGAHAAAVGTAWLLSSAMLLSLLTAYTATGVITSSRRIRAVLALGWAGAAPLMSGLDTGRLGPVLVHLLAPWIVASVVLSRRNGPRGTTAAFALALLCGFAAWWVPLVLLLSCASALVVLLGARGWARLRALPIAVLPMLLAGPQMLRFAEEPLLLLGGAGATDSGAPAITAWQALLLHAGGPLSFGLWWIVPAWVLALIGAFGVRRSTTGGLASALSVAAIAAAAAAVVASRLHLGVLPSGYPDAGLAVTLWPGTFLSLGGAALLLAAGLGATDLSRGRSQLRGTPRAVAEPESGGRSASRSVPGMLVLAVAVAGVVGTLALHAMTPTGPDLSVASEPSPAVVAEQAAGPDGVRLIELTPEAAVTGLRSDYGVTYALSGVEPAAWVRDRASDLVRAAAQPGRSVDPQSSSDPLGAAVADLVDTTDVTVSNQDSMLLESELADLAVGYVALDAGEDHPLVSRIEAIPSLTRVSAQHGGQLWRVLPDVAGSRIWSQTGDGRRTPLPMVGPAAQTRTELASDAEFVGVSQPSGWAARADVTLDGVPLKAEPGFPVRYAVPPGGGSLVIRLAMDREQWWWGTAALGIITALLALPIVRASARRSR